MKRSNFTFLFLFALLSFVSLNLGAQATSSSCIDEVNITVDAQCGWVVNEAVLGATGPAMMAQSVVINGVLFPMTGSGAGFSATGSLTDINLPDGGTGQFRLFQNGDGTGPMLCWGDINYEIKMTPDPDTMRWDVMCSQPIPLLPKLADVAKAANGACSAEITNVSEYTSVSGNACDGFVTERRITGLVNIDGTKSQILLRLDSIVETPLDTSMVTCPIGGPGFEDALYLSCERLGDVYPSPDEVYAYYYGYFRDRGYSVNAATNKANQRAYPYVSKGVGVSVTIDEITPIVSETIVPTKILINGLWVLVDVVVKDTIYDTTYITETYPIALPLPKGVTCNLTVKCTDMQFAGCAGPDSKIMRTWQVLDWCNGSIKECMQWIVVEPDAPYFTKVQGKKVTRNSNGSIDFYTMWPGGIIPVDIAPWTCAAQLPLTAMVNASCAPGFNISWSSTFGTIGSDNVLRGLWYGEQAHVTATATSDCGSHGEYTKFQFWVVPRNYIHPVAIAEDEVNVSLVGDPTGTVSTDGIAKVFVNAIDAGSHNAGCGPVETCLLLKAELEDPILINDKPVFVNGKQIYHAKGCGYDGILKGVPATKLTPGRPDYPYSICKEFVKFCCSDLGPNLVALVVTNDAGHSSHSWSTVNVEDKSRALYYCSPGATLDCGKGYNPLSYAPTFQSAVCTVSDLEYTIASDIDACGTGLDVITWTLDGQVICTTKIYFTGGSKFNAYEIKWPKHFNGEEEWGVIRECELWLELNSKGDAVPVLDKDGNEQYRIVEYDGYVYMGAAFDCAEGDDTGQPVWCEAACALVGSSFEPLEVEAADACKKIIRRWTVIDWCTWDPNTSNQDDENDTAYDQFQAVDDEWLDAYDLSHAGQWWTDYRERYDVSPINVPDGGSVTKLECDWCDKQNAKADVVYFRYTQVDEDGYYTYDQVIKVIDETDPVIDAPDEVVVSITDGAQSKSDDYDDCNANEDVTATVTDMCGDTDLSADGAAWWIEVYVSNADSDRIALAKTKTAFGTSATMNTQTGTQGAYHLIVWQVRDGCGNIGEYETLVKFVDDKKPTPICIQDLSTAIMPTSGTVEIWAADYDNGSFDNCSEVEYWFLLDSLGNPTDDQETGTYTKNLLVTCDMLAEFGQGETLVLGLYVSDAQLNIDFCNITLNVNGAAEVCDLNATAAGIYGEASTLIGDKIQNAEILLNVGAKDLTSVDGQYAFNGNALFSNYEIKAQKNDDYINGVSTLDLVLTQKFILGLQAFDSPYKVIAADINNDGAVTAADLVQLRQFILGITDGFPQNDSWRFVDATQTLDIASPWPFREVLSIQSLDGNMYDQNFVGVKIGDVSGNAVANELLAGQRSVAGKLTLQLDNATAFEGETVEVAVTGNNFTDIFAYQFTMELSGLEFVGTTSGAIQIDESNFGLIDARTVTTAWISPEAITSDDALFTMTFRATQDVSLSDAISISSRITEAVAYTSAQDRLDVGIEFNSLGEAGFALLQNTPNPFDEYTNIGFELPTSGAATLTVFDVTGKTISVITQNYGSGYNEITLRKSELGTSGVLYYQLESGDFTATRKMILID